MAENAQVKKVPLIAVMLLATFVAVLNETLMTVALHKIMEDLQISASTGQWLTTGFLLVMGVLIPITAFFIQRFSTRSLFFSAMGLFTTGTLIAGIAPNFIILMLGRVIQAMGTGIILPLLMTVILSLIPPQKRGSVMGTLGVVITFAPALGPTVSGFVVQNHSWRLLYYGILPIALLVLVYGYFTLKNVTELTHPKIDWLSVVLSTLAFGGIVLGFSSAGEGGWGSPKVVAALAVGLSSLVLFTWRQLQMTTPMLDLKAFQYSMFSLSTVIMMVVMMSLFAGMMLLPLYLQDAMGFPPLSAGLLLLPGGLLMAIMSPITGRIFDKIGAKMLAVVGLTIMVLVLWQLSNLSESTSFVFIMLFHSALMLSISMLMMPVMTTGLNQLPKHLYPHGTAIINTIQQVSAAVGTALLITIMTTQERNFLQKLAVPEKATLEQQIQAMTVGVNSAFAVAAGMTCIALVLAFFLKRTYSPDEAPRREAAG